MWRDKILSDEEPERGLAGASQERVTARCCQEVSETPQGSGDAKKLPRHVYDGILAVRFSMF